MTDQMNSYTFGVAVTKLAQTVERLDEISKRTEANTDRIDAIENRFTLGKGAIFGLALGVMFMLYGVKQTIVAIAKNLLG